MSITLVLCLMVVLRILSFSLTLSILLSIAHWLVSSFFTNAFVRDHVWHPYRGFPTRMVYLYYISCLRYTIPVGNPHMSLPVRHTG